MANLYRLDFPPSAATLNAAGLAPVTLPEERAGLLTLPGFSTARSRPDQPSVVGRGLAVNAAFLCAQNLPFPELLVSDIEAAEAMLHDQTEREKAAYRMETSPYAGCHLGFDPTSTRSCATQAIATRFESTDGSFSSLVIEVALAEAFREPQPVGRPTRPRARHAGRQDLDFESQPRSHNDLDESCTGVLAVARSTAGALRRSLRQG